MFTISKDKCIGCGLCVKECPFSQIKLDENNKAENMNTNCMDCGHCFAVCPNDAITAHNYDLTQVTPIEKESTALKSEDLLNLIKTRRSVRQFSDKAIEKELLEQIIEAGRYSATGCNAQDVTFSVVTENLDKLKKLTYETLNEMATYILGYPTKENEAQQHFAGIWKESYKAYTESNGANDPIFHHAKALIVTSSYYETNAAIAASNMELMIHTLGLGGFYNGFFINAANESDEIKELLQLERGKKVVASLAFGYPNVTYRCTVPRKPANTKWL